MASDKLDPRFDPAFQRGFDERASNEVQPAAPFPFDMSREAPTIQVAPVSHAHDRRPAEAPPAPFSPDVPALTLHGNPWVRALWVISGVFVVGGLGGQVYSQSLYSVQNYSSVQNFILPSLISTLAAPLVLVGLASAASLVFLHAVRWRPPE